VAPATKPVPVTVKMNVAEPCVTLDGEMLVRAGGRVVMVSVTALEAVPPGFAAVICAVPACATRFAGTAAVSCVALTKVVASAVPFKDTVAPLRKLVPVTVSVNAEPAGVVDGVMLVIVGPEDVMVNVTAFDAAPPLLVAVTCTVPACVIRSAVTAAESCVPLIKLVFSFIPFHNTAAPEKKPVPVTANENAGPPASALAGAMLVMVGAPGKMVKATAFEGGPFGLEIVIWAEPGCAMRFAGTVAETCVALTKVVAKLVPLNDTAAPVRNPLPVRVNDKDALPAVTLDGETEVITGAGATMLNIRELETRLPLAAVIAADPGCAIRLAPTAAVNCVALTNDVASGVAAPVAAPMDAHARVVFALKPVPLTVSMNAGPPAAAEVGAMLVSVSGDDVMLKIRALEAWFPFCTVIEADPGIVIRFNGPVAEASAVLIGVVDSANAFQ
jgi:hypothetical protein